MTNLTDDQILTKLNRSFKALNTITEATAKGFNRSAIVYGAAGVGKSHGVVKILDNLPAHLQYTSISGNCTAVSLYELLYQNRAKGTTTLIDDCDTIFTSEQALNILKAATDTKDKRVISWKSKAKLETETGEDIPSSFVFEGQIIILTNVNVAELADSNSNFASHVSALLSRSQYIDLGLDCDRAKFLRVRQVVQSGVLQEYGVDYTAEQEILFFIESNLEILREISIRTALKIASNFRISPDDWKDLSIVTCCK